MHVISGSYGSGHDSAAREVSRRLRAAGHRVEQWDVVEMFPARGGRLARWLYLRQLETVPDSWGALLDRLQPGSVAHRVACTLMQSAQPAVADLARSGADLFVSTHPFASQVLGEMRRRGRLAVPAVTYLTDASVHPLWVHPDVDVHLGLHPVAVEEAVGLGGRTLLLHPLLPDDYRRTRLLDAAARAEVRGRLGVGAEGRLALVVGGSLGIGELERTACEVRASGLATPVVACGTNEVLRERLANEPGVVSLGWRDDLPALLQVVDCVVQNSGGFTTWEALAAGTPVVSWRPLPGHGVTNADALRRAGLVAWPRDLRALETWLGLELGPEPDVELDVAAPA